MPDPGLPVASSRLEQLERDFRDLAALLALPAMWKGRERERIVPELADVLISLLRADFVFASTGGARPIEIARLDGHERTPAEIAGALREVSFATDDAVMSTASPGLADLRLLRVGLSVGSEDGSVVVGCRRPEFPTQSERFLLRAAVNQTGIALENAEHVRLAREANRAKDEFLAVLSHELRTPLNAISGWVRMLRDGHATGDTAAHALVVIERNVRRQAQLIEDLLDLSRIITGNLRLEMTTIDLAPVISSAVDAVRPAASAKDISIDVTIDPQVGQVDGDASRLEQIVWNLLTNATKFTGRGGRIQIDLRRRQGEAEIVVRDNGQGIAPEMLPQIFDRFRQADAGSARNHGGLGLGLTLVRALTEAHRGSVEATSGGAGTGAVFRVRLPVLAAAIDSPPVGRSRRPVARIQGVRVLVVDDELDARELLAVLLERAGAVPLLAGSVAEALELFDREQPHVLIADIGMPGRDGFDLIRIVRARPDQTARRTPAIALTAFASTADSEAVRRAGYDAHVSKPFDPDDLVSAIAWALPAD